MQCSAVGNAGLGLGMLHSADEPQELWSGCLALARSTPPFFTTRQPSLTLSNLHDTSFERIAVTTWRTRAS